MDARVKPAPDVEECFNLIGKRARNWHSDHRFARTAGRASLWGIPYSETPIRFDDLKVTPTEPGQ